MSKSFFLGYISGMKKAVEKVSWIYEQKRKYYRLAIKQGNKEVSEEQKISAITAGVILKILQAELKRTEGDNT